MNQPQPGNTDSTAPPSTMTVYSLSAQQLDDNQIDTTLYLTEWQAYEALIRWLSPMDILPDDAVDELDEIEREDARFCDETLTRLHANGLTPEIVKTIQDAAVDRDRIAFVTRHDHPWIFGESKPDRVRELERSLAYELCISVLDSDLTTALTTEHLPEELRSHDWYDENSDIRTDELIPDVIEYLTLRGLVERDPERPGFFAVRDESEGVA